MEQEVSSKKRSIIENYFAYIESKRPTDRLVFFALAIVCISSLIYSATNFMQAKQVTVPTQGGTFTEGIVGTPRFVNPVLAITRTDQDVTALIYSGLMKLTEEGSLTEDLAKSVTRSEDGLVYNIVLRDDAYFHDGTHVTADDVAYTIALIQDPMLKSPLRGNWADVVVEVISDTELNIVLKEPYTPFIENLTVGIIPKHVWGNLSIEQLPFSQHNTEPIGSGPYQLGKVTYNQSGLIESYTLRAADKGPETARITTMILRFYQNEESLQEAFKKGEITGTAALSYQVLDFMDIDAYTIVEYPLPRVFSVFFNQNRSAVLRDPAVREALSAAIDRNAIIASVLHGYGFPTDAPIPPGFLGLESGNDSLELEDTASSGIRYAETVLIDGGWQQLDDGSWQKETDDTPTKLSIELATANNDVFEETATILEAAWRKLGVDVRIARYEQTDLVQTIIRPRNYEALLFGVEIGRFLDLFPFWHSSQKDDPGLNVALYTNIATDELLETARTTIDEQERTTAVESFVEEISDERPAIFLYSPSFTYVISKNVTATPMKKLLRPSERFSNVAKWHMEKNSVWPLFTGNN